MASSTLTTVISGGQTGADQAALVAARKSGLLTGGWAPPGYRTLMGSERWLQSYGLVELDSPAGDYVTRSKRNVDDSDATLAFRTHASPGTDKTIGYALTGKWQVVPATSLVSRYKPLLIISDATSSDQVVAVVTFLQAHHIRVLNVCGHRETEIETQKWTREVEAFLLKVFESLKCQPSLLSPTFLTQ